MEEKTESIMAYEANMLFKKYEDIWKLRGYGSIWKLIDDAFALGYKRGIEKAKKRFRIIIEP